MHGHRPVLPDPCRYPRSTKTRRVYYATGHGRPGPTHAAATHPRHRGSRHSPEHVASDRIDGFSHTSMNSGYSRHRRIYTKRYPTCRSVLGVAENVGAPQNRRGSRACCSVDAVLRHAARQVCGFAHQRLERTSAERAPP